MTYTVLARRYRSQAFDEVVGQEAIARTLQSAIDQGRVAHAYLFVGTRGVGKTTMARLLAKALNGGTPEVDQAIMTGQDTDVIEIDAASNRGVEEARDLIANCIYRPLRGRYKIYIIDEVHMLTREAFNTLLKTLEEPPEHVKFILCTTEPHKVLPTIQSRCQRFDFRNIPSALIVEHLTRVVEQEGLNADADLLRLLARMAAGSMRDALSLMDRIMAAAPSGEPMTVALLEDLLGLPARDVLTGLVESLADGDPAAALQRTDDLIMRGVGVEQVIDSLVAALHDLLLISTCGEETDLVDLAGEAREREVELARRFEAPGLVHMIAQCEGVARMIKASANPRALLDALIVRLAMTEQVADVAGLLRSGAGGGGASSGSGGPGRSRTGGAPRKKVEAAPGGDPRPNPAEPDRSPRPETERTQGAPAPAEAASPSRALPEDPWERVKAIAEERRGMRRLVDGLSPVSVEQDRAVVTSDHAGHLAFARGKAGQLADLFKEALGRPVRVEFQSPRGGAGEAEEHGAASTTLDPTIAQHELVREAMVLFDARITGVEKDPEAPPADPAPDQRDEQGADDRV